MIHDYISRTTTSAKLSALRNLEIEIDGASAEAFYR
jgi:hypothetical protein